MRSLLIFVSICGLLIPTNLKAEDSETAVHLCSDALNACELSVKKHKDYITIQDETINLLIKQRKELTEALVKQQNDGIGWEELVIGLAIGVVFSQTVLFK